MSFRASISIFVEDVFFKWIGRASVHKLVDVHFSPMLGFGLTSKCDAEVGTVLLSVPPNLWQPFSARYSKEFVTTHSPDFHARVVQLSQHEFRSSTLQQRENFINSICMAKTIMNEVKNGSPYPSFLREISARRVLPHPLQMDAKRYLRFLNGTTVRRAIDVRRRFWDNIAMKLFDPDSREEFKWALGIILSRALSDIGNGLPFTLVPILDFANHSAMENAEHMFDATSGTFHLVAAKSIKLGEGVQISYGKHRDSAALMALYGFYDEKHSLNDALIVPLVMPPELQQRLPISNQKLASSGKFKIAVEFLLGLDRVGWENLEKTLQKLKIGGLQLPENRGDDFIPVVRNNFQNAFETHLLIPARQALSALTRNDPKSQESDAVSLVLFSIHQAIYPLCDIACKPFTASFTERDLIDLAEETLFELTRIAETNTWDGSSEARPQVDSESESLSVQERQWRRSCSILRHRELEALLILRQCCRAYLAALT